MTLGETGTKSFIKTFKKAKKRCPCGTPLLKWIVANLLQLFKSCFVLRNDVYFRYAQVPNAGLGHIHASMAATLALRICLVEKLLQVLKGCFILCNNFSLRSELGSFSIDDCFGGAAHKLLVRKLFLNRSGECLGLFNLFF